MTRKPRKNLKSIKQNRPPYQPLTTKDVRLISDAGNLNCADDEGFYDQLDDLRDSYRSLYRFREIGITDRQFRVKIQDALKHITGLRAFLSNAGINLVAHLLLHFHRPADSGAVPDPDHPDQLRMLSKQREAVAYLEHWLELTSEVFEQFAARKPNNFASPSAAILGLDHLVVGLAIIWRNWSNGIEICTDGRHSRWIPFLRQSLNTIAQRDIGEAAARKLTRRVLRDDFSPTAKLTIPSA
jgi:hypothetical protein